MIVRTPRHLMAVPEITINDVLGILNAVNKCNIATVALKGLRLHPDNKFFAFRTQTRHPDNTTT
jgi:hypothetical protein